MCAELEKVRGGDNNTIRRFRAVISREDQGEREKLYTNAL